MVVEVGLVGAVVLIAGEGAGCVGCEVVVGAG